MYTLFTVVLNVYLPYTRQHTSGFGFSKKHVIQSNFLHNKGFIRKNCKQVDSYELSTYRVNFAGQPLLIQTEDRLLVSHFIIPLIPSLDSPSCVTSQ